MNRRALLRAGAAAAGALALARGAGAAAAVASPSAREWSTLRAALAGHLVLPRDGGYDAARAVYDLRFASATPAAVAYCASASDVQRSIDFCRAHHLAPIPRCGGHSFGGYSTGSGLIIDVSPMNRVAVHGRTATVGAGHAARRPLHGRRRRGRARAGRELPDGGHHRPRARRRGRCARSPLRPHRRRARIGEPRDRRRARPRCRRVLPQRPALGEPRRRRTQLRGGDLARAAHRADPAAGPLHPRVPVGRGRRSAPCVGRVDRSRARRAVEQLHAPECRTERAHRAHDRGVRRHAGDARRPSRRARARPSAAPRRSVTSARRPICGRCWSRRAVPRSRWPSAASPHPARPGRSPAPPSLSSPHISPVAPPSHAGAAFTGALETFQHEFPTWAERWSSTATAGRSTPWHPRRPHSSTGRRCASSR